MYVTATNPQSRTFVKAYHDVLMSPDLNPTDKLVYLTLLSYQEAGLQVFPSNDHVAKSLGLSKSTVIRSTGALEKAGLITKVRRFNNSNLVTVNSVEVSKCNVQRCQSATSRGVKMTSYKNTDNNKDKISLENEGQSQNIRASLSRVNKGLYETRIHCDESVSDLNLDEEISKENSLNREKLATKTYASMPPAQDDFDDEPLDHDDDYSDDSFTATPDDDLPYNDDEAEPIQNIFSGGNRIGMAPHQVKRQKQFNRNNPAC
ncbi:helix-turn-helix domain-containing protein [Candidatus Pantoea bituminis]|uniref:helix-turn-helix domain-containing protein n=1 Tax=Candidatus Pantoea bituminis TaxID=2831036 RepID=UPI001C063E9A|nr:helix-turn-helix domain-containing protein [Pantoea bituminis]